MHNVGNKTIEQQVDETYEKINHLLSNLNPLEKMALYVVMRDIFTQSGLQDVIKSLSSEAEEILERGDSNQKPQDPILAPPSADTLAFLRIDVKEDGETAVDIRLAEDVIEDDELKDTILSVFCMSVLRSVFNKAAGETFKNSVAFCINKLEEDTDDKLIDIDMLQQSTSIN